MTNQALHALAGFACLAPFAMWPGPAMGVLCALLLGAYREQGQMSVSGDRSFGWSRVVDTGFHAVGGLAAGMVFWV